MKTRIITAICMGVVLVPIGVFSHTAVFPIAMALLCGIGCFEMLRCIGVDKKYVLSVPCIVFGAAMPIGTYYFHESGFLLLSALTAVLMFWVFVCALFSHGEIAIEASAMAFLGLVYLVWRLSLDTHSRQINHGAYLYLLPFVGAWVADSFAYFTGRLLGRHKLIPDVSPKKTVEGAVGGVIFTMLGFVLYGWIVSLIAADVSPNYLALLLLGLPISVVSMIGDLVMSLVKRRYEIKDYGNLFPGHGGVLDRFDSVLATGTVLYLLCAFTPFFGLIF